MQLVMNDLDYARIVVEPDRSMTDDEFFDFLADAFVAIQHVGNFVFRRGRTRSTLNESQYLLQQCIARRAQVGQEHSKAHLFVPPAARQMGRE